MLRARPHAKTAALLATIFLTAACGDAATKTGPNGETNANVGLNVATNSASRDWSELEYILPESNVEILPAGEVAEVRIGACSLVNGEFVGLVEATSVSDRIPDVCTGETRRIHRIVTFDIVETFTGLAEANEYLTTLSIDPPLQPGDRALVNLITLPNGEYAASAELRVIPFGDSVPDGYIDATPGHVDLPPAVVDLKAAMTTAAMGECAPGTIPPTSPDQVAGFYTTPREEACQR